MILPCPLQSRWAGAMNSVKSKLLSILQLRIEMILEPLIDGRGASSGMIGCFRLRKLLSELYDWLHEFRVRSKISPLVGVGLVIVEFLTTIFVVNVAIA